MHRTGLFSHWPGVICRASSGSGDGDQIGLSPVRSANTANPSRGGDAKPGIFRKSTFRRPPGCQAPHIDRPEGGLDGAGGSSRGQHGPSDTHSGRPGLESRPHGIQAPRRDPDRPPCRLAPRARGHARLRLRPGDRRELDGQHDRVHRRDGVVGRRLHRARASTSRSSTPGVSPVEGLATRGQDRVRPRPLARIPGAEPDATSTPTATARSWPGSSPASDGDLEAPYADAPASAYRGMAPTPGSSRSRSASPTAGPTSARSSPPSTGSSSTRTTTA